MIPNRIKELLKEFDLDKNTKEDTISFLVYVLQLLVNGDPYE